MRRAIFLLLSVIIGTLAGVGTHSYIPGLALLFSGIACHLAVSRKYSKNNIMLSHLTSLHTLWPCLILSGLAAISANFHNPSPTILPVDKEYIISAEVIERQTKTRGEQYIVKILDAKLNNASPIESPIKCRNIKAFLYASPAVILEPGDIIKYKSLLEKSVNYRIGQPQYVTQDVVRIYNDSVNEKGKRAYRYGERSLIVIGKRRSIHTLAWTLREKITISLERSSLSHESAELLQALLLGDRSGLDEKRLAEFRDAGVAHALAVSGMHVGVLSTIIILLTIPLQLRGLRISRLLIILSIIWTFTLLTGWHYSTIRASIMVSVILIANLIGRRNSNFRGLCISAIIILLLSPDALWDVGFQLSFTCVAALIIFMEPLNPLDKRTHPILYKIAGATLVSIIATGATWVLTAYYFNAISLNFLIANIIVLPLLPAIMGMGMIFIIINAFGTEITVLSSSIDYIIGYLFKFLQTISSESIYIEIGLESLFFWLAGLILLTFYFYYGRITERTLPGALPITQRGKTPGIKKVRTLTLLSSIIMLILSFIYFEL